MKLPEIKIQIDKVEYANSFSTDIKIDRTDLDGECVTHAERYAYYAFLAEEAKANFQWLKYLTEQVYAVVDADKRNKLAELQAGNPKFKYTETMVKNQVITDPRYKEAVQHQISAQKLAGQLVEASRAMAARRDMLQMLGANARVGLAPNRVLDHKDQEAHEVIARNLEEKKQQQRRGSRRAPKTAE